MTKKQGKRILRTFFYDDEPLYGMSDTCTKEIQINIQYIWSLSKKNQDTFIRLFSISYCHELIHILVGEIVEDLYTYGEEKSIRSLLHEEWNNELSKYYSKK